MTDLRFEIYPGATPTSGLLATLNKDDYEDGTFLRQELNGTGSGQIVIHGEHPDCTAANFARGNYVKVIDLDLGAGEAIGGFFLSEGEFVAVSRKETGGRVLTFGGPGSLAYLGKAAMDSAPYVASGDGAYNGPRDDMLWHWGVDNTIGSVLKRIIDEAQDADRPTDPIPSLTYDFDNDNDSAVDPWDFFTGSFTLAVGTNYLSAIETFMRLGLTIMMEPTLELHAYQEPIGTDRSSGTFGAGKVRFVHGTNIAIGTAGDAKNAIHESPRLKQLLVAGEGAIPATVVRVTDAGAPLEKEGFMSYANGAADGVATLTEAGERELELRAAESLTSVFVHKPGNNFATGEYTPGWPGGAGHYWIGDTITYHTGTDAFDFDEEAMVVAAIGWKLRAGGDWEIQVEVGASYYSIATPSISGGIGGGVGCNCCPTGPSGPYEFGTPATTDVLWTFDSGTGADTTETYDAASGHQAHLGDLHTQVTNPGVGNYSSSPKPPVTAGNTYQVRGIIARNAGSPYNPSGISMEWSSFPSGTVLGTFGPVDVGTLGSGVPTEVGGDVVIFAGDTTLGWLVLYNNSNLYEVEISHGGSGTDTFPGDPLPPAASGLGGIGTPGCMFAYFDHFHAPQIAAETPIGDAGGYYSGVDVEDALQELGASMASVPRSWKIPARVATTASGTMATSFENGDTVDGVTLATGDRILIKDQATSDNGVYTVNASGAPTRATDFDGTGEAEGAAVYIREGTANGDKIFTVTNNGTITIGSTTILFAAISGAGGSMTVQEDDSTVDAAVTTLDFTTALKVTSSPAGEANIAVDLGTASTQAAAGNHTHSVTNPGNLNIIIGNGVDVITTGVKAYLRMPFAGTFTRWSLLADVSGAIKVDVWKDTLANYPPVDADSITNAQEPEITASGTNAEDTTITGWTGEDFSDGDVIGINVDSCTSIKRCTLELKYTRS